MYYSDGEFLYNMEKMMWKHSEEWQRILFNVLKVRIALLANRQQRIRPQDIDIHGVMLDIIDDAIPIFDKFLISVKGYTKYPIIDAYNGEEISAEQDIDYKILLSPFKNFFTNIEVK